MAAQTAVMSRPIAKVVQGIHAMEGAGVRICRTLGTSSLKNLDPYLMLDELKSESKDAAAGFPSHPHRGFETCSIMLEGAMDHEDSAGNKGTIQTGGVQWMTAGRGIIHSEMPKVTHSMLHGFQLWINLPAKHKMCKPHYQDYQAKDIPVVEPSPGVSVRVMAGQSYNVTGPILMRNPGLLLDVRLDNRGGQQVEFKQIVPHGWNGFAYVYEGSGSIGGTPGRREQNMVLGQGDHVVALADRGGLFKFLLVAGQPIGEPIVQHGPFVMNTREEIMQAFTDYSSGRFQNPADNPWTA
mmetsp:Transcript_18947/g.53090  ORF Transcript_18947/g.53090 Transcript_18947/m.53090 type:complete len:296 (+) Transcript_18947:138-1025(+)